MPVTSFFCSSHAICLSPSITCYYRPLFTMSPVSKLSRLSIVSCLNCPISQFSVSIYIRRFQGLQICLSNFPILYLYPSFPGTTDMLPILRLYLYPSFPGTTEMLSNSPSLFISVVSRDYRYVVQFPNSLFISAVSRDYRYVCPISQFSVSIYIRRFQGLQICYPISQFSIYTPRFQGLQICFTSFAITLSYRPEPAKSHTTLTDRGEAESPR